jgi:hypothetical protein
MTKFWFRAKWYGWGWYPSSWEGWLVTGIFSVLFITLAVHLRDYTSTKDGMLLYLSALFSLVGILMIIAYKKGERPRWRWGK